MLNYAYKIMNLVYQYIFNNNTHISNILFKFSYYKLFVGIDRKKFGRSKIYIYSA